MQVVLHWMLCFGVSGQLHSQLNRSIEMGRPPPQTVIFVGTLIKGFVDNVSLSGGSSCKWYINLEVPEAKALAASVSHVYQPVKWDQHMTSNELVAFTAPKHKVSDIKMLHPFKYKKTEWLVTVMVQRLTNHGGIMHARSALKQQNLFVILSDALSLSAELLVRLSQGTSYA